MTNLLQNPSFENGWQTDPIHGNQTPQGWSLTWLQPGAPMLSTGAFPGDDDPQINNTIRVPECVHKLSWQLPPNEQLGGPDALILDGDAVYKVFGVGFSATLSQTVAVTPGARYKLRIPVQVHHHGDGSYGACALRLRAGGVATEWLTFHAGLPDPALRDWAYPSLEFVAPDGIAAVVIDCEGRAVAPVDFFIDAVSLEQVATPTGRGAPRVQYERRVFLLHADSTPSQWQAVALAARIYGGTLTASWDDAGIGDLDDRLVLLAQFDDGPRFDVAAVTAWFAQYYPGVIVEEYALGEGGDGDGGDGDPGDGGGEPEPPDDWTPLRYIERGTALGFHCAGGYPLDRVQTLAQAGVVLPTTKLLQSIGDLTIAVEPYRLARLIDWPGTGNLEGFDYNGNPEAQADARMAVLMPIFAPYRARLGWLEIINEQDCATPAQAVLLARFYIRAMAIAEANGYKLALFSFSMGCPEQNEWRAMVPTGVFEMAAAGGHAISLHEYGNALDGPDSIICRYRWLYDNIILPRRLNVPLFITEYNVEAAMIGTDLPAQWRAYDALVRADPYVAGVHLYSLGSVSGPYVPATVAGLTEFVDYAISQRDVVNG